MAKLNPHAGRSNRRTLRDGAPSLTDDHSRKPSCSEVLRELRPHILWDAIKELARWCIENWRSILSAAGLAYSLIASLVSRFRAHTWVLVNGGIFIICAALFIMSIRSRKKADRLNICAASTSATGLQTLGLVAPVRVSDPEYLARPTLGPASGQRLRLTKVSFEYLVHGETLFEHGWKLSESNSPVPLIQAATDAPEPAAVRVEKTGFYGLDFDFEDVFLCDYVRFIAKFKDDGVVYLKFSAFPHDGSPPRTIWLAQVPVGGTVPHADGSAEWKLSQPSEKLSGGWLVFDLSVADQMQETFKHDQYYVCGIRIRGSLSLCPIELFALSTSVQTTVSTERGTERFTGDGVFEKQVYFSQPFDSPPNVTYDTRSQRDFHRIEIVEVGSAGFKLRVRPIFGNTSLNWRADGRRMKYVH